MSFFSCDWGTTSFRLRLADAVTGAILSERRESCGVKSLFSNCRPGDTSARERAFADFLRQRLQLLAVHGCDLHQTVPVVISGMASSSVGWRELPYARVPVALDGAGLVHEQFDLSIDPTWQARIHLISGVCSDGDIMRGEEMEVIGLFADGRYPAIADDGWVVLPGTHAKHVRLRHGQMTAFHTYMTGELFDLLATHTLLKASVQAGADVAARYIGDPACRESFVAGVHSSSGRGLAASLFQTRVRTVLQGVDAEVNRWFLSGLLIGAEICDLAREDRQLPVFLAAPEPLSAAYRLGFETLGLGERVTVVPPAETALALVRGHGRLLQCSSVDAQHPRS